MSAKMHLLLLCSAICRCYADGFAWGDACAVANAIALNATTCEEHAAKYDGSYSFEIVSDSTCAGGCTHNRFAYGDGTRGNIFNTHPGSQTELCGMANNLAVDTACYLPPTPAPPTPAPTIAPTAPVPTPLPTLAASGSMSGDPIVYIHGHKIKLELPSSQRSLMWKDDGISVFAAADVITPDKKSQWFSDFLLFAKNTKVAHIQMRDLKSLRKMTVDDISPLSLTLFENGAASGIAKLGTYDAGGGAYRLLMRRLPQQIGQMKKDIVKVDASSISFSLAPEKAKKFADEKLALIYAHLDVQIHKMHGDVKAGIIAELYGFVPLSASTAMLIKKVKM